MIYSAFTAVGCVGGLVKPKPAVSSSEGTPLPSLTRFQEATNVIPSSTSILLGESVMLTGEITISGCPDIASTASIDPSDTTVKLGAYVTPTNALCGQVEATVSISSSLVINEKGVFRVRGSSLSISAQ